MPVGTQATVKAQTVESLKAAGSTHLIGKHLPPAAPSRTAGLSEIRRHSSFHELGRPGAYRLRWFSDFLAATRAGNERSRRPLSKLRRWQILSVVAGVEHRDAESHRRRHHDGARSMHPVHCRITLKQRPPWSSLIAGPSAHCSPEATRRWRCSALSRVLAMTILEKRARSFCASCRSTAWPSAASRLVRATLSATG